MKMTKINQISGVALWLAYCEKKQEVDNQQQEIAELKQALADLNQHDDEITDIETTNMALAKLADARINKLVDENSELKTQEYSLTNALRVVRDWNSVSLEDKVRYGSWGERDYYRDVALNALNKTPAQSLQSVRADLIKQIKSDICMGMSHAELSGDDIVSYLNGEETKLREGES
jgi:mannitol-1-phosphate/altronate dehydrogenase